MIEKNLELNSQFSYSSKIMEKEIYRDFCAVELASWGNFSRIYKYSKKNNWQILTIITLNCFLKQKPNVMQ